MKGNQLTYVVKKLMSFMVLVEQGVKVNWSMLRIQAQLVKFH